VNTNGTIDRRPAIDRRPHRLPSPACPTTASRQAVVRPAAAGWVAAVRRGCV
jgi:hypothetical protein